MATFRIEGPTHLLQTFRLSQAMAEADHVLQVSESASTNWAVSQKLFGTRFEIGNDAPAIQVRIDHATPTTGFNGLYRPLIYPHAYVSKCREMWGDRSSYAIFIGNLTESRKAVLSKWLNYVTPSKVGAQWPTKIWDDQYMGSLATTKCVLCPPGDYEWTYRFYEAMLCGALPIVEKPSKYTDGYHVRLLSDKEFDYSEQEAIENFNRAVSQLTVPTDVMTACIDEELQKYQ
jgi:hypothetical protein